MAIVTPSEEISYGQFEERCLSMGNAVYGLGLKRGDRVAFLDTNSIDLALAHFALPACGLAVLPLNHRLSAKELDEIIQDADASVLFYSEQFRDVIADMRGSLPSATQVMPTHSTSGEKDLCSIMKGSVSFSWKAPEAGELATLLYTSGTTGRPKGVQLTHGNSVSTISSLLIELGLKDSDVGIMAAPLFHVAGCHTYMSLIARGCTVHLMPGFEPVKTLRALGDTKATVTLLVPAMINALLNAPGQEEVDLSSLRLLMYAGAPMPPELLRKAIERLGYIFFQLYGLTETSVLTVLGIDDHKNSKYISSAGREMFGSEVRLVDDSDNEVRAGSPGQIIARGDNVTPGYWNAPHETLTTLKNGWFYTGDIAIRDEEGYFYLKDRKKDMVVTGGENVYPVEVENVLHEIPGLLEAAVVGVPDERWGEKLLAIVCLKQGIVLSREDIMGFCRERLAAYKCPKDVEFRNELPRTPSGKVRKNVLREPYWEGFDRRVH
jgi:acyl-CoA synthetase (AMP-forming)/AMP-acid ligase II